VVNPVIPGRLLLATGNQKKLKELREILTPVRISVVAPVDIGYDPEVDETGTTFEANAILKAEAGLKEFTARVMQEFPAMTKPTTAN
jgi:XTP/dITP diphosphohydrolase